MQNSTHCIWKKTAVLIVIIKHLTGHTHFHKTILDIWSN